MKLSQKQFAAMIKALDHGRDGMINYSEFSKFVKVVTASVPRITYLPKFSNLICPEGSMKLGAN